MGEGLKGRGVALLDTLIGAVVLAASTWLWQEWRRGMLTPPSALIALLVLVLLARLAWDFSRWWKKRKATMAVLEPLAGRLQKTGAEMTAKFSAPMPSRESAAVHHMGQALVESDHWRPSAYRRNNGFYVLSSLMTAIEFPSKTAREGWQHFESLAQTTVERQGDTFDALIPNATKDELWAVFGCFETIVHALSLVHSAIEELNAAEGNRLRTDADFQQNVVGFNGFYERLIRDAHNVDLDIKLETGIAVKTV